MLFSSLSKRHFVYVEGMHESKKIYKSVHSTEINLKNN